MDRHGGETEILLPDKLEDESQQFSGFVRYENCLEVRENMNLYLGITDAYEGVEVF